MPPKSTKSKSRSQCTHPSLCTGCTPYAQETGFIRPDLGQRLAAAVPSGVVPSSHKNTKTNTKSRTTTNPNPNPNPNPDPTFKSDKDSDRETDSQIWPAPLVLPGSEISLYPNEKGQSLRSWLRSKEVNRVYEGRKTVYISLPPAYGVGTEGMRGWKIPKGEEGGKGGGGGEGLDYGLVAEYVGAFYHGLTVKGLEGEFEWVVDGDVDEVVDFSQESGALGGRKKGKGKGETKTKAKSRSKASAVSSFEEDPKIGLHSKSSKEYTSIRSRPTPNYPYSNQLNLNDILDFAIANLPDDAFALLMSLEHDLYEEEEDEFVCGRAYGGSRVAVVSGARYWPGFDEEEDVERVHGWPASHCERHVEILLQKGKGGKRVRGKEKEKSSKSLAYEVAEREEGSTPLHRALTAYSPPSSPKALTLLHIARLARTASHELGHCFGIAHCTYYACIMQGSSSLAEDARQPPYLCPVDEAKVSRATAKGVVSERRMEAWRRERLGVMKKFCGEVVEEWGVDGTGSMFACLEAWVDGLFGEEGGQREERERVVIDLTMDD